MLEQEAGERGDSLGYKMCVVRTRIQNLNSHVKTRHGSVHL